MTEWTAEVGRAAKPAERERRSRKLTEILVAEAPPEADELAANAEVMPGWACAAIIIGLAATLWAVIILVGMALLSK